MSAGDVIVAAILFVVVGYEMVALARSTDALHPYTYYLRRLIRRKLAWVAALMFWLWLGYHFFVERG